jgi:hypothetical protein
MKSIKSYFCPVFVLLIGLITSQIIFTIIVYDSDLKLASRLAALKHAGYLTVPNPHVTSTLSDLAPAFYGALFFTLTTGAGITWITLILTLAWISFSDRKKFFAPLFAVWAAMVAIANINGINVQASLALITLPMAVARAGFWMFDKQDTRASWKILTTHFIVLILICLSWVPHLNADAFISVRDNLLLGNSLGRKVNDFYYTYTLYPAEVFKSIDQKMLKTCALEIDNHRLHEIVENKLRDMDYLTIDAVPPSDVTILGNNQALEFIHNQKKIMEASFQEFLSDPDKIMKDFSTRCDTNAFFRETTFLSLLFAMPITIYILIQSSIMLAMFFVSSPKLRFGVSAVLSLAIGVSASIPLYDAVSKPLAQTDIVAHLRSKDWQTRTAALKKICDEETGIDQFLDLFHDPDFEQIPEKYWFARALSLSRNEKTINILHEYLNDAHPNVICMALYSLGKRKHGGSIDKIIELIQTSDHWYVQWYAYKALRRIGWIQPERL